MSATRPHERSAACGPPTRNSARYCPPIAATLTPNERGRVAATCARLQPRSSVEKYMGRVAADCRRLCVPAARPQILQRQTTVPRVNHSGLCRIARAVIPGMRRRRALGFACKWLRKGRKAKSTKKTSRKSTRDLLEHLTARCLACAFTLDTREPLFRRAKNRTEPVPTMTLLDK